MTVRPDRPFQIHQWEHLCRPCQVTWRGERTAPCWICDTPSVVAWPIVVIDYRHQSTYAPSGTLCPEDLWSEP